MPGDSVLVLQHAEYEPGALYEDQLRGAGLSVQIVEMDRGGSLPSIGEVDAVVSMGGPMSVNDEAAYPWLVDEKRFIRDFVRAGGAFWGVCLGAQLLASALGARVYEGSGPEVGVLPVHTTEATHVDPVFSVLPPTFPALQWHNDTFDLPKESVLLASSDSYQNQAFRWMRAYGIQFHLEVSAELVRTWGDVPAYAHGLEVVMGSDALPRLLSQLGDAAHEMHAHAVGLFKRWLDGRVSPPAAFAKTC